MTAQVDLVAVAYNAPLETRAFLHSFHYVDVPFTLTIVENASPNLDTRPILEAGIHRVAENPLCVQPPLIIYSEENLGYARGCNLAAQGGKAPILGLLNCDVQFLPGVVSDIVKAFEELGSRVAIIGPKTIDSRGRLTHSGIVKTPYGRDEQRHWMAQDIGQADDVLSVPSVVGATFFIRREVWQELTECPDYQLVAPGANGAFLPTQHFYEETYLAYHARAHGYEVMYLGTATMIHEWHRSSPVGSQDMLEPEMYFRRACAVHGIELSW